MTEPAYIKARQVAQILGVSLPQVYAKAASGTWPSYRIDGMRGVRFKELEMRALIKNNLDRTSWITVSVPKLSKTEIKEHVKSLSAGKNLVDRFLNGSP